VTLAELDMVGMAKGSLADVRRLYSTHAPELRLALARLAGKHIDSDDLLQEVFVVAMRKMNDLAQARSERAWLYGVALKLAAGQRRRHRLRSFLGLDVVPELASVESPARTLEQKEASLLLQAALDALPAAKREVLVLFELQGLSGEEIAHALEVPLATVWTRLFHARKALSAAVKRLEARERRHD
jgi:RNA polymerase sigma-70 factor (ECF subfamily)